MKIFKLYLPLELFNRIKLMAQFYNVSISKMMTHLLEIGYIKMLDKGGTINETNNK